MYQPKRFAISLSAISLYPSAISLSVDVRSRLSQLTCGAVAGTGPRCPRRGAPRCVARDSPQIMPQMRCPMCDDASRGRCRTFDFETLVTH